MNIFAKRVEKLRQLMYENELDAYIILSADPHFSEYLSQYYKIKDYISGFKGSVGSLVFTQEYAFLWVDGRYWLQAQRELEGSGILLQKQDRDNTFQNWLKKNLTRDDRVGLDFTLLNLALKRELEDFLTLKHCDLIQLLWKNRPQLPQNKIYIHEEEYSILSAREKISIIRDKMDQLQAQNHLISSLDDIAYLTNLRGSDVEYNPVFLSHLLIKKDEVLLFVDECKISEQIRQNLKKEYIHIRSYQSLMDELRNLKHTNILIEPSRINALIVNSLHPSVKLIEHINPSTYLKACKNNAQIEHIQNAMIEDGIALCKFFAWLEEAIENKEKINELDIDAKITEFRAQSPYYISNSFSTIAGFNANAAFPHYKATKQNHAYLEKDGLLLLDSGGQYKNGTTDITRVVPIGRVSDEQIRDYTLVLKAHIAISKTVFPKNIPMPLLDAIARAPLWENQLDYNHGTGHGVGYFLNVHEGPQVLSYLSAVLEKTRAQEGMLTSIEPGIYRSGKWGIRLENLVVNTRVSEVKNTEFGEFLYFKTLSLCPFEPSCIDVSMLNEEERAWINDYHKQVYEKLSPKLEDGLALRWLEKRTQML